MFAWTKLLKYGSPIIVMAIIVSVVVGYVTTKENQIRELKDELGVAESRILTDTLIFESKSVVVVIDSTKVRQQTRRIKRLRDMLLKCSELSSDINITEADSILDDVVADPYNKIIEFDSTKAWGPYRITFHAKVDCGKEVAVITFGKYFPQLKPQKRFGFGIFIGSGVTGGGKFDFMLGVGLTYRIKSF